MDNNYILRNNIHVYAEMEKQPDSVTARQRQNQMLS